MAEEKPEPTERTPKGLEVPVPKRKTFFANLKLAAAPKKPPAKPAEKQH
ncbi:MAG TPA: hypothetical protein VGX69_11490 [Solirubrobacteraceae bacterium]|jgi:hypothetical protein|nr:hypothetical protein [Solirubrobacteraceae bacterium]